MDGFFSGLGLGSSKKKNTPSSEQTKTNIDVKNSETTALTKISSKSSELKQPAATLSKKTDKQAHQDRSSNMRLSKNPPKKVDNDFDIPAEPITPSPTYTSSSTNIGTKVEPKVTPCATIGPKISFKGELSGEEDLLVQGYVEGTISLKNNHLIIGKQGKVKADISAKTITVEGSVEGDIEGQDKVEIKATSQVDGNLKADRVILEDGAKFRGSIDMGSKTQQKPTSETLHTSKPTETTKTPDATQTTGQSKKADAV